MPLFSERGKKNRWSLFLTSMKKRKKFFFEIVKKKKNKFSTSLIFTTFSGFPFLFSNGWASSWTIPIASAKVWNVISQYYRYYTGKFRLIIPICKGKSGYLFDVNISGICGILRLSDDNVIEVWKNLIAKTKLSYLLALSAMYIIS